MSEIGQYNRNKRQDNFEEEWMPMNRRRRRRSDRWEAYFTWIVGCLAIGCLTAVAIYHLCIVVP